MASASPPPRLSPPLPIAKRLNRNALTVVAVLLFMTVLIAVITTRSPRPAEQGRDASTDPVPSPQSPSHPSFLDVPLTRADTALADPETPESAWEMAWQDAPPLADDPTPYENAYGGTDRGADPAPPSPVDPAADAYQRALRSPVVPAGASTPMTGGTPGMGSTTRPGDTTEDAILRALLGTREPVPPVSSPPTPSGSRDEAVLRRVAEISGQTTPYQLNAGTVIPAALITAVNSDIPGPLVAQVTRSVYDSRTQQVVVIPQGTKLVGQYDHQVTGGQQRLMIAWTRMIFPNGQTVTLPEVGTSDRQGAAGVPGHVNRHTRRVFGNALLLSAISAGLQLSQPQQSTVYAPPSAGQVAAGAVGQQLGEVATEMIRKQLDIPPTITLNAGTPVNVLLREDLPLPGLLSRTTRQ